MANVTFVQFINLMGKKKNLILLTDYYPFDNREPYIKNEMPYLQKAFDRICIFCSYGRSSAIIYPLATGTTAHKLNHSLSLFEKLKSLRWLFNSIFWNEIKLTAKYYQLPITISIIKTILHQLQIAAKYYEQVNSFLLKNNLGIEDILFYSYWTDAKALAATKLKMKWHSPAISRAHGWDVYFERQANNYLPFRKYLHDHLSAVYFVSENGRNYSLAKIPGATQDKFRVAYIGTISHGKNPDATLNEFVIVSCASLIPLKRIHLITTILDRVKNIPIRWIHFGDGEMKNDLITKMENAIALNNLIQFDFRGDVDNETLIDFYQANHVDLFMLTSEYEGLPLAIMEALSFGIPVVATDVGGIGEIINKENGLLLEKNFLPETVARFISDYHSFTAERKQNYRDAALNTWKKKLNAETNYGAFINEIRLLS